MKAAASFRSRRLALALLLCVPFLFSGCTAGIKKARHLSRGDTYFKNGDFEKAKIEYLNVLRLDPGNLAAVQQLGTIWYEEGAPLHALPYLLAARRRAPENVESRTRLGQALLAVGQAAEARKEALAVLQKDPLRGEAALLLANTTANPEELAANQQVLDRLPEDPGAFLLQAKAGLALRAGNPDAAQADLDRALAAQPRLPSVHLALAALALARQDTAKAGEEFKTAASLAPARSVAHVDYANYQIGVGARDEAKAQLAEVARRAPDYLPAWQVQAQIAALEGNYDASTALLEHVFTQDPDNLEARLLQASNLLAKNEVPKAVEILDRLDHIYKGVPTTKIALARADLRNNNRNGAIVALNQTLALAPDNVEAVLLLSELRLDGGEAQDAAALLGDLLKRRPGLVPAQLLLANALRALGKTDEAVALVNNVIKAGEKNPAAFLLLGQIESQQNKPAEARASLERAREIAPDSADVLSEIVNLDLRQNDAAAAMREVHAQLQKTPDSPAAHFLEARVYYAQKEWDHAAASLRQTLALDANFADATSLLISTDVAANRLPDALTLINGLLAKNPNNPRALLAAAQLYSRQNEPEQARDAYEKLLAVSPDSAEALNNLAYLYAESFNQLDKAYDFARRARGLLPNDPAVADTLGWILYKRADYPGALALAQEAAAKLPDDPSAQFHLGMASYQMGQTEAARTIFERLNGSPADFPGKADAARRLAVLRAGGAASVGEREAAVKNNPGDPVVLLGLGAAYEKQQAWDKAADAYQQALKANPRLAVALDRLARLYAGPLHDPARAFDFAKAGHDLAPDDVQGSLLLGRLAYQTGNLPQAYTLLRNSVRDLPNDPGVRAEFALADYALGNVDEAREDMQAVLKLGGDAGPAAPEARRFLTLTAPGLTPPALAALEPEAQRALQTDPNYLPALMVRGTLQSQRGDAKGAVDTFNGMLQRAPDFLPAQKQLAALYLADANTRDKAYDLASRARKAAPNDPEVAELLGVANYFRKAYPYALQLLQESARRRPLSTEDRFYLGMCYAQTKQTNLAQQTLSKVLADGLPEPMAAEARQALADAAPRK